MRFKFFLLRKNEDNSDNKSHQVIPLGNADSCFTAS